MVKVLFPSMMVFTPVKVTCPLACAVRFFPLARPKPPVLSFDRDPPSIRMLPLALRLPPLMLMAPVGLMVIPAVPVMSAPPELRARVVEPPDEEPTDNVVLPL